MSELDRLTQFLERLLHANLDDFGMIALPEPDSDERARLLGRASDAAVAAGPERLAELRSVPDRVRATAFRSYSFRGYDATLLGLNWGRSIGRAADRARLVAAIEDAAVAEVLADLLPEDDLEALREPFELASSMAGTAPGFNPRFTSRRAASLVAGVWLGAMFVGLGTAIGGSIAALLGRRRSRRPDA